MPYNSDSIEDYSKKDLARLIYDGEVTLEKVLEDGLFIKKRKALSDEIHRMVADDQAWNSAVDQNTIEGYKDYLKAFGRVTEAPKANEDDWISEAYCGRYVADATAKLDYLIEHPDEQGHSSESSDSEDTNDVQEVSPDNEDDDTEEHQDSEGENQSPSDDSSHEQTPDEDDEAEDDKNGDNDQSTGDVSDNSVIIIDSPDENDGKIEDKPKPAPVFHFKKWAIIAVSTIAVLSLGFWGYTQKKQADEKESQQEIAQHNSEGMALLSEAQRLYDLKDFKGARAKYDEYIAMRKDFEYLPDTIIPWIDRCDTIIKAQAEGTAITPELAHAIQDANVVNKFASGLAVVRFSNGDFKVVDTKGNVLTLEGNPSSIADSYSQGFLRVGRENGFYLDTKGKLFRPANSIDYEDAESFTSIGLAKVKGTNGKYGFIDTKGHEVVPPIYSRIESFSNGLAAVGKDGLYGFINKLGSVVVPIKYDCVTDFSNGFAFVRRNSTWFYINKSGKEIAQSLNFGNLISKSGYAGLYPSLINSPIKNPFYSSGSLHFQFRDGLAPIVTAKKAVYLINTSGNIAYRTAAEYQQYLDDKKSSSVKTSSSSATKSAYSVFSRYVSIDDNDESESQRTTRNGKPYSKPKQRNDREIQKFGLILGTDTIFPAIFDKFEYVEDGFYKVRMGDHWGYADKYGITTFDYLPKASELKDNQSSRPVSAGNIPEPAK